MTEMWRAQQQPRIDGPMDGPTDGPMDGGMDELTDPPSKDAFFRVINS